MCNFSLQLFPLFFSFISISTWFFHPPILPSSPLYVLGLITVEFTVCCILYLSLPDKLYVIPTYTWLPLINCIIAVYILFLNGPLVSFVLSFNAIQLDRRYPYYIANSQKTDIELYFLD
jgi:hypothetical protein